MPITNGYKVLLEKAMREVCTYSVHEAFAKTQDSNNQKVKLVDIRDVRELQTRGKIAGSVHAPRGMLEFWVDPDSPYYKPVLGDEDTEYILFCAAGWRSALAAKTLQDMGMQNVAHIEGGFGAWAKAGLPIESPSPSSKGWMQQLKRFF